MRVEPLLLSLSWCDMIIALGLMVIGAVTVGLACVDAISRQAIKKQHFIQVLIGFALLIGGLYFLPAVVFFKRLF